VADARSSQLSSSGHAAEHAQAVQSPPREAGGISLRDQLLRPRTLISFAVSLGLIAWIFARQDIPFAQVWANMRRANPWLYVLGMLAYYSTFYVRTLRWKQVLENAGYSSENEAAVPRTRTLTRIIFLSWFANSILPAKLGDGYRGFLLKRNANVSFSKTMGTILAERIADVGALFTLLLAAGLLAFRHHLPPNFGLLMGFGAALAALSLGTLFLLRYVGPWVARVLPLRARPYYARMEEGVLLAYRRRVGWILLMTTLVWILESARFWFVAASLGQHFSLPLVVFIALAASLLTTVPFTPAGLGVVEGAVVAALLLVVDNKALAGSIALLDRTITYWSLILIGAIVYLFSNNK
jgi:uncharacterized membrane protein YbhN (UPF0104 family)